MSILFSVSSPAKINLHLRVGHLDEQGYHVLNTVYQAISLYDTVTVSTSDTIRITGGGPADTSNLVWKAVEALAHIMGKTVPTLAIDIHKNIPEAGGLAGGSSNAAAVLRGLGREWNAGADELELAAQKVGSDVPFLLHGGICLGTGRGEVVTPVLSRGQYHWVIVADKGQLSTPTVYAELDRIRESRLLPASVQADTSEELLSCLTHSDSTLIAPHLINDLQPAAISLMPSLRQTLHAGMQAGAVAGLVSGSGPTCIFLANDFHHATEIAADLAGRITAKFIKVAYGPVPGAHFTKE